MNRPPRSEPSTLFVQRGQWGRIEFWLYILNLACVPIIFLLALSYWKYGDINGR